MNLIRNLKLSLLTRTRVLANREKRKTKKRTISLHQSLKLVTAEAAEQAMTQHRAKQRSNVA